jgi:hypothetical protein
VLQGSKVNEMEILDPPWHTFWLPNDLR